MKRSPARILTTLLLVTSPGACQTNTPDVGRVQRVVATGAQGALAPVIAIPEAAPQRGASEVDVLPQVSNEGGVVRFVPDASHREIATARAGARIAVAWTDDVHDGVWFGLTDATGTAIGRGARVHGVAEDEERVGAPTVVAVDGGFAVAWVDGDNGRVMFARLDAERRVTAAPTIVHDGLDRPRAVTLAWSGRDFGVGVSLWRGVYFTRVDARGERSGDGAMMSEGEAETALESVRWERDGYVVAWTETRQGRAERVQRRIEAQAGHGVVGVNAPRSRAL